MVHPYLSMHGLKTAELRNSGNSHCMLCARTNIPLQQYYDAINALPWQSLPRAQADILIDFPEYHGNSPSIRVIIQAIVAWVKQAISHTGDESNNIGNSLHFFLAFIHFFVSAYILCMAYSLANEEFAWEWIPQKSIAAELLSIVLSAQIASLQWLAAARVCYYMFKPLLYYPLMIV